MEQKLTIRTATIADLEEVTKLEQRCFPIAEAATRKALEERLLHYPNHFWLLMDGKKVVGMVNGMLTNEPDLSDKMYEDVGLHNKNGQWQMIFGLDTSPEYRNQGCATRLMQHVIDVSRKHNRQGIVLTCKEKLVQYYAKFGFVNEGVSTSKHGDVQWYQMRLTTKNMIKGENE